MSSCSFHQRSSCHTLKTKNKETQIKTKCASVIKLPNLTLQDVSGFEGNKSRTETHFWHFRHTVDRRSKLVCKAKRTDKCYFASIFPPTWSLQSKWLQTLSATKFHGQQHFLVTKNSRKNNGPICRFRVCRPLTSTRDPRAARETDLKTSLTWGIHLPLKTPR